MTHGKNLHTDIQTTNFLIQQHFTTYLIHYTLTQDMDRYDTDDTRKAGALPLTNQTTQDTSHIQGESASRLKSVSNVTTVIALYP